jgi:hypothetical protein
MLKLIKKHYMPLLASAIFISVFLYQFFCLVKIPFIKQYSLQEINYINLLVYLLVVLLVVSLIYNFALCLTIEISISFRLSNIRVTKPYQETIRTCVSKILISKRYKSFSVYRCWFIVFSINAFEKYYERITLWKTKK